MPAIIHLIGEYDGVLHRHESIAGNLGACPLGPILIKRFERLFDGPPRVLKSHGKDSPNITWLDVVEFAKNKPEQFNLEKTRNGVRVCQFYTKQCRVEISEEDFVLIASGMPQKMIPPQPIIEDEEKELGALEILEKNLQQIIQVADQVSARARQLNHRLKNRRTAIVTRRENDLSLHSQSQSQSQQQQPQQQQQQQQHRSISPVWRDTNGSQLPLNGSSHSNTQSPSTGFVAVNTGRPGGEPTTEDNALSQQERVPKPPVIPATAAGADATEYNMYTPAPTTVAIPNTPSSLLPPPKSHHHEKDDGGPFKMEMVARMEELQRGERILPPCDRCRRLHMDCLKNLTACMGCTKKHAKCSWKDVKAEELQEPREHREPRPDPMARERPESLTPKESLPTTTAPAPMAPSISSALTPPSAVVVPEIDRHREVDYNVRRESAPTAGPIAGTPLGKEPSPRRAMSEIRGGSLSHDRHIGINRNTNPAAEDDDPDANQRLMQAILDTVDHHARAAAAAKEGGQPMTERDREQERDRDRKLVKA
ncbi:putative C6 finger domain protein [Aspergillus bombycis]|uniref:Putative C6 finger domain protein n=1 Tax=Aspergillus bombycis TaxID=109264 RepID=A0A1F7ZN72_9EURO|nr:putative C6 finger domain protein [Aspergillus bombycis]OGM40578.1 putative C6 finger domain protein [Aspergillus bombycis]